jgi:H+/gluconate symporter-like permease
VSFLRAVAIVFKNCVRDAPRKQSTIARLTIALDALGATYLKRAAQIGMDPALLHRVAVIGSGTLDSLPHNGAVATLLSVCGSTHSTSYKKFSWSAFLARLSPLSLSSCWARL